MDTPLVIFILAEVVGYLAWIFFVRTENSKSRDIVSFLMFALALVVLVRVFQLNLDFGLVLSIATLLAGISWFVGYLIKIKELRIESKSYFIILFIITCFRSFTYEPYQIPSRSMEPGLQIGDFVLVNKYAYGLKFPGTHYLLTDLVSPKRNDIAVFLPPHSLCKVNPQEARPDIINLTLQKSQSFLNRFLALQKQRCTEMGIKYVKRVLGVPGDLVEIKGDQVWINGVKLLHEVIGRDDKGDLINETLDSGTHVIRSKGISDYEEFTWKIPEGSYLAIGDNRDNSLDSRVWGYFSDKYLIGKAEYIWLHWGSFSELPGFFRNGRIQ
jgi:signal peptidase I